MSYQPIVDDVNAEVLRDLRDYGFEVPKDYFITMFDGSERRIDEGFSAVFAEMEADENEVEVDVEQPMVSGGLELSNEEKSYCQTAS